MSEWAPEVCKECLRGRDNVMRSKGEVARLARLMSRSERAVTTHKPALLRAKADLAEANRLHESHIATCEGLSEAPHGSVSRYSNGHCRCEECTAAHRLYQKHRQEQESA